MVYQSYIKLGFLGFWQLLPPHTGLVHVQPGGGDVLKQQLVLVSSFLILLPPHLVPGLALAW
jgi:hypothetical protein